MTIDINNNREEIFNKLKTLNKDAKPVFGKLGPQNMVEHLAFAISISTGNGPQKQFTTEEEGNAVKSKLIHTDIELPMGVKNPLMGDEPPALKCADMDEAVELLKSELEKFDSTYKENSNTKMTHPRMGPLDQKEWSILHNKHIAHHFKQYELI